ncbi:MAG: Nif3-like dinuclear metal center hexameric protein [Anaerovoracaceae bacterium]
MKLNQVLEAIRLAAPEELQEEWDNSGIQIRTEGEQEIQRILTCLEINDDVVEEAIQKKADLIVTHHPLIFSRLSKIDGKDITGNQILRLIQHGISVYSAHTSFDSAARGTNQDLAQQLELTRIVPMFPRAGHEACGMGRYGVYEEPMLFEDFAELLSEVCPDSFLQIAGRIPEEVARVAICTGSGAEFIDAAAENGADVYVTGDVKYHDARHADDIGLCVVDAGHYGTEILFARNMAGLLLEQLGDAVEIFASQTDINPFW